MIDWYVKVQCGLETYKDIVRGAGHNDTVILYTINEMVRVCSNHG